MYGRAARTSGSGDVCSTGPAAAGPVGPTMTIGLAATTGAADTPDDTRGPPIFNPTRRALRHSAMSGALPLSARRIAASITITAFRPRFTCASSAAVAPVR